MDMGLWMWDGTTCCWAIVAARIYVYALGRAPGRLFSRFSLRLRVQYSTPFHFQTSRFRRPTNRLGSSRRPCLQFWMTPSLHPAPNTLDTVYQRCNLQLLRLYMRSSVVRASQGHHPLFTSQRSYGRYDPRRGCYRGTARFSCTRWSRGLRGSHCARAPAWCGPAWCAGCASS